MFIHLCTFLFIAFFIAILICLGCSFYFIVLLLLSVYLSIYEPHVKHLHSVTMCCWLFFYFFICLFCFLLMLPIFNDPAYSEPIGLGHDNVNITLVTLIMNLC